MPQAPLDLEKINYRKLAKRLRARRIIILKTGCWEATGNRSHSSDGRSWIMVNRHSLSLSRLAGYLWLGLANNPQLQVNHKCTNEWCWNPKHLYLGTQKENMADRDEDGTTIRGPLHHNYKYSNEDIKEMKRLVQTGVMQVEVAKIFGTRQSYVSSIVKGVRRAG